jgi:hypothetical protein
MAGGEMTAGWAEEKHCIGGRVRVEAVVRSENMLFAVRKDRRNLIYFQGPAGNVFLAGGATNQKPHRGAWLECMRVIGKA